MQKYSSSTQYSNPIHFAFEHPSTPYCLLLKCSPIDSYNYSWYARTHVDNGKQLRNLYSVVIFCAHQLYLRKIIFWHSLVMDFLVDAFDSPDQVLGTGYCMYIYIDII